MKYNGERHHFDVWGKSQRLVDMVCPAVIVGCVCVHSLLFLLLLSLDRGPSQRAGSRAVAPARSPVKRGAKRKLSASSDDDDSDSSGSSSSSDTDSEVCPRGLPVQSSPPCSTFLFLHVVWCAHARDTCGFPHWWQRVFLVPLPCDFYELARAPTIPPCPVKSAVPNTMLMCGLSAVG